MLDTISPHTVRPPARLLLGPGPSNVDPRVTAALAAPIVGHLDPFFLEVMEQTMADLRRVFRTANHHTIPMSGTGSAGLETIMLNLLEPGDEVVVGVIGYFGERLAEMARRAGATVRVIEAPPGEVIAPERIETELRKRPARLVALVHAETSTGAWQPVAEVAPIAHHYGALLAIDCVTSLGGVPVEIDAWGVDAAGSCSQKCLGAPPGLGPVTFGPRAMEVVARRRAKPSTWYFDLRLLFQYWGEAGGPKERAFHHTAPVASIYAFREALALVLEEGLEPRWARHRAAHQRFADGLERLGLSLFTPAEHRLPQLNVIEIPPGVADLGVRRRLLEMGIEIAGGFGPLTGKVWRVGLMGTNARPEVVDRLLGALEEALREEGWSP
ncbi:MAG TPA: alanine--glyoxylate aminotransferase family protein [Gemmatimonadales bacterium]|nr:alanine--glyoxylate aminotransferase family protein [Gemmatimonadales bacterium]